MHIFYFSCHLHVPSIKKCYTISRQVFIICVFMSKKFGLNKVCIMNRTTKRLIV